MNQKRIKPGDLVDMGIFAGAASPLRIDLAYASPDNLLLGQAVYRAEARLWLHRDLADIVLEAAALCHRETGYIFVLYDGLRTVEAQALMLGTRRVQENPQWLQEPRLLSPPGTGGHPRAMAVDIGLLTPEGVLADMGTVFDHLAADPSPAHNPAHREHPHVSPEAQKHRGILTDSMMRAAQNQGRELLPLPQEWWDFRFPKEIYDQYAPLADADLPPLQRMALAA